MTPAARRARTAALALGCALLATACNGEPGASIASGGRAARRNAPSAAPAGAVVRPVAPLKKRVRPDVLVVGARPLSPAVEHRLRGLAPAGVTTFRQGVVKVGGAMVGIAGVDPSPFRTFAPQGTAEANAVWDAVARGDLVVAHDTAKARHLALGKPVAVGGRRVRSLRLAALAITGLPGVAAVVSGPVAAELGLPAPNAAVLTAGTGDPAALASAVRRAVGGGVTIHLLTQPQTPYAFLTGSRAAKAFGAFSYRWYDDGTIEPDARWVASNIVSGTVPILGRVTCHRLMLPQLRAALAEVQAAGLGDLVHSYDGCYVPRFIERDPSHPISLHTWGIAIDLDAASNQRGGRGTMDARVVAIFKRWGFRWGGDWSYTDPMHFELGALIAP
ncbi:MAG TPA: M15 family metallopeptidase [Mycobacteriales bacterium]|nr:M15 family metallopeptidase [Mycobacteriales bacterium]